MDVALLGTVLLWAAVASALAAVLHSLLRPKLMLKVAAAAASLATVTLGWALVRVDLSLEYVAATTSRATPWPYRLAALWGGMDGSMLFYAAMTAVVAVVAFGRRSPGPAARVAAGVVAALLGFTAVFANPFIEPAVPPIDGSGLLAILQHPAMIYHPPLLYLGLTTLLVPFALTSGPQLMRSSQLVDRDLTRRWLLVSWTLLTFGMVAGSSWAYVELGWGGFWAWDPVENTALMPWLAITAFLHTSRVNRRDGRLGRSTAILAMLPFALSVLGVYLTRSGITGSIHAFAEDPVIGRVLLGSAVFVAAAVVFLGLRAPSGPEWGVVRARRDSWLAGNAIIISTALVFVLIGSAYPAYARVFFTEEVAIDSTFYVLTVYPLALAAVTGLALALRSQWSLPGPPAREWAWFAALALVGSSLVLLVGADVWPAAPGVGLSLAAIVVLLAQLVWGRGRDLVALVAHLGLALVVLGAAGSALGGEFSGSMRPGESVEVSGHTIMLEAISTGEVDRFAFARAVFRVDRSKVLAPEIRGYEEQAAPVAEPALWSTPAGDVIVAISLLFPEGNAVEVSVFVRPLVWWVWLGSLVIGAAGLLALFGRDGVGAEPRPRAREAQPAGGTASGRSAQ